MGLKKKIKLNLIGLVTVNCLDFFKGGSAVPNKTEWVGEINKTIKKKKKTLNPADKRSHPENL